MSGDFGPDFWRSVTVQVSSVMRRGRAQFFHWCPACEEMHPLPFSWKFDGDLEKPTFSPSFLQNPQQPDVCHYNVIAGEIHFHADSWHHRSDVVPMVPLVTVGYADV